VLGDSIFHVHAKGIPRFYERNLPLTGVLDTKSYTDERHRAWIFRTCGTATTPGGGKNSPRLLRMFGYDLRAFDRARGQSSLAGRRPRQGGGVPERNRHEGAARSGLVGVK